MKLQIPSYAQTVLDRLHSAGFEAWVVGGCVRDSLLGRTPQDWDVTTSARPQETLRVFSGEFSVYETGIAHGTVTVLCEDHPLEVTTYRVDGSYSDGRHPDFVTFTTGVEDDLSRRDFTVNAMAYDPRLGLRDPFGGQRDLKARVLRCVGDPDLRFREDALRLLRALRFSSVLGFSIEEETAAALLDCRDLLSKVAPERISAELLKLLCGPDAAPVLRRFYPVLFRLIPELAPLRGLDQKNPHHSLDAWEHTLAVLSQVPPVPVLRLAALLHDVGKGCTFTLDEAGVGHFYGHEGESVRLAEAILPRLRLDNGTRDRVLELIRRHGIPVEAEEKWVRRWLSRLGPEALDQLLSLKRADVLGQAPEFQPPRLALLEETRACMERVLAEGQCFTLRDLAVSGRDLLALGIPSGPGLGRLLSLLLDQVLDGTLPNERDALLQKANTLR